MSSTVPPIVEDQFEYPTGDGRPMAETPVHRQNLTDLIAMLQDHFAADPEFYVSGNMFLYYVPAPDYRCLAPDVFVVRGIPRDVDRDIYKTWEEGKGPDLVIELTSKSTQAEDLDEKFKIYRDQLQVREYFLFDPRREYLRPPLRGYRLRGRRYRAIEPVNDRLPSEVLGLHFERAGPLPASFRSSDRPLAAHAQGDTRAGRAGEGGTRAGRAGSETGLRRHFRLWPPRRSVSAASWTSSGAG